MYENFYGLTERPFNLTPDPKFLFLSTHHREAFAHLFYGIKNRCGFVLITGEIGTGKTTICRSLLHQIGNDTEVAFVFNPALNAEELLETINQDLGITSKGKTKKELIDILNEHLLKSRAQGKNVVLVIDEAQNLATDVLEQVRLLSNLETDTEKLIQIVLIGQPELQETLELPEIRQLNQRITARYHLPPLDKKETIQYIQHRLRRAGDGEKIKFTGGALRRVYSFSRGVPRLINLVCDRALLAGYTAETHEISAKLVKKAIFEIEGTRPTVVRRNREFSRMLPAWKYFTPWKFVAGAAVVVLVASVAAGILLNAGRKGDATSSKADATVLAKGKNPVAPTKKAPDKKADANKAPAQASKKVETEQPPQQSPATATKSATNNSKPTEASEAPVPSAIAKEPVPAPKPEPAPEPQQSQPPKKETPAPVDVAKVIGIGGVQRQQQMRQNAIQALLSRWVPDRVKDKPASTGTVYQVAQENGLECQYFETNLTKLELFNLPFIMEVIFPEDAEPRYLAVLEMRDGLITRSSESALPAQLSFRDLEPYWLGRVYIFWKDTAQLAPVLSPGQRSASVARLQEILRSLDLYKPEKNSAVYDEQTTEAVKQFQREYRLYPDGVVGYRTRVVIYGNVDLFDVPRLKHIAPKETSAKT